MSLAVRALRAASFPLLLLLTPFDALAALWPVDVAAGEVVFRVHQLQPDRWSGDGMDGRAAVTVLRKGEKEPTYGVVFFRARSTASAAMVSLEGLEIGKGSFPWERDGGAALLALFRGAMPKGASLPLASVTASPELALSRRELPSPPKKAEPRVIPAGGPTVLVLVDGDYVIRPVPDQPKALRVVNTPALLLQDPASSRFYLPMGSRWLVAAAPNGRWTVARRVPPGFEAVREKAASETGIETYAHPGAAIDDLLRSGKAPRVVVSTVPAVLAGKEPKIAKAKERSDAVHASARPHDVYAGPDGNAYRPAAAGRWEKTNGRDWYPIAGATKEKGIPKASLLDLASRLEAELRARDAGR